MPTLPSEQANEPHRHREMAESFGVDAARYDRARPRYPEELIRRIAAACPGPELLDVGCGTGISARQFQATGARVLGIEPDDRMASFARDRGLDVEIATFETWQPSGRTFDGLIAGQAWHWVDPAAGAEQAARVLRPQGRIALIWNVSRFPEDAMEAFAVAYRKVLPDSPGYDADMLEAYQKFFVKTAGHLRATGAFGEPEQWRVDWAETYTRERWLDVLPTHGIHTRLSPSTLDALCEHMGAAVDSLGGSFTLTHAAIAITATRV